MLKTMIAAACIVAGVAAAGGAPASADIAASTSGSVDFQTPNGYGNVRVQPHPGSLSPIAHDMQVYVYDYSVGTTCSANVPVPTGGWTVDPALSTATLKAPSPCGLVNITFAATSDPDPFVDQGARLDDRRLTTEASVDTTRQATATGTIGAVSTGLAYNAWLTQEISGDTTFDF